MMEYIESEEMKKNENIGFRRLKLELIEKILEKLGY